MLLITPTFVTFKCFPIKLNWPVTVSLSYIFSSCFVCIIVSCRCYCYCLASSIIRPTSVLPFCVADTPIEEFTPTPAFPALQYLESVDEGGVAWQAGLRTGDFLIEVRAAPFPNLFLLYLHVQLSCRTWSSMVRQMMNPKVFAFAKKTAAKRLVLINTGLWFQALLLDSTFALPGCLHVGNLGC